MSKKNKVTETPAIYAKLPPPGRSPFQKDCLVLDKNNVWFRFKDASHIHLTADAIVEKWPNSDPFMDHYKGERLQVLHTQLFNTSIPEGQNELITSLHCWNQLAATALNRTESAAARETTRQKNLESRQYIPTPTALANPNPESVKTPQARACLKLLIEACKEANTDGVSEATLRKYVDEHQADLRTRQDPWRIFQYYRPTLVKEGLLRHD